MQYFNDFSPPVSFADSPLVSGGLEWRCSQLAVKLKFDAESIAIYIV